ncbi:substrate-binding domain-containing protein [Streptomyces sp. CA-250714]|uniref:substrate-binding domain-containing protein n=1 Tax=Streptomyces sp. CA-250714 TaxID=3240060 RepID=UPI003D8D2A43
MRVHVDQRHQRVLEIVRRRGSLRVAELAEELGVSAVTVRRDVEALAGQGLLRRLHGAVVWPEEGAAAATAPPAATAAGTAVAAGAAAAAGAESPPAVVGMVVPSTEHYFAELVRGAQEELAARGGRVVVGISNYRRTEDEAQVARMLDSGVDGLLLVPVWEHGVPEPEQERALLGLPLPTVVVDRRVLPGSPLAAALDVVRSDHVAGAARAVHHLAALGHEEIALLVRETPNTPQVMAGWDAGFRALARAEPPQPILMDPPADPAGIDTAVGELCEAIERRGVRAALVHNDQDALGVLQRLTDRGLRVPEDLALVAYEDDMAALANVPLTAVAPPRRAVGAAAVRRLLDRLPGGSADSSGSSGAEPAAGPCQHLALVPELHVRASCGGRTAGAEKKA